MAKYNIYQIYNRSQIRNDLCKGWDYLNTIKGYISSHYVKDDGSIDVFDSELSGIVALWNQCYHLHLELDSFVKKKELKRIYLDCEDLKDE